MCRGGRQVIFALFLMKTYASANTACASFAFIDKIEMFLQISKETSTNQRVMPPHGVGNTGQLSRTSGKSPRISKASRNIQHKNHNEMLPQTFLTAAKWQAQRAAVVASPHAENRHLFGKGQFDPCVKIPSKSAQFIMISAYDGIRIILRKVFLNFFSETYCILLYSVLLYIHMF